MTTLTSNEVLKDKFVSLSDKYYQGFKSHWRSNISVLLTVFIVLLIIINIIGTINFFVPTEIKQNITQPISDSLRSDIALYRKIPHWHIFGIPPAKDLAVAHISVKLSGVILDVTGKQSIAIISTPDGKEKMYKVGDALPGGAVIYAITPQEVIIQYLGRLERLPLFLIQENKVQNNDPLINPINPSSEIKQDTPSPNITPGTENYKELLQQLRKIAQ